MQECIVIDELFEECWRKYLEANNLICSENKSENDKGKVKLSENTNDNGNGNENKGKKKCR